MDKPKCPKCGRRKAVIPQGLRGDLFICTHCNHPFDSDPDEGGDYSDRDPSARLQRQERQARRSK